MAITDHFRRTPDEGFIRSYDSQAARRQLQVSLALIVVLAAAALALGVLVHFGEPDRQAVPLSTHDLRFAAGLTDFRT